MCTVPSVKLPSGAAGDGSDIGCGFGAVWPSFVIWPPRLPLACAKAVLAASAPTSAPMKTVRFIPGLPNSRNNSGAEPVQLYRPSAIGVPRPSASSAFGDDDVAAECPDVQRGAAVAEHGVCCVSRSRPSPIVTRRCRTERDGKVGSNGAAEAVRVQLEPGIARQRQAHAPGVRIEVVASALAERADEFDAAAD